jgi:hypothetical protein
MDTLLFLGASGKARCVGRSFFATMSRLTTRSFKKVLSQQANHLKQTSRDTRVVRMRVVDTSAKSMVVSSDIRCVILLTKRPAYAAPEWHERSNVALRL